MVLACVCLSLLGLLATPGWAAGAADPVVVQTDKGAVRGVRGAGVDRFLGIRYAVAPVGDLRWRAPQPAPAWSDVRPATEFGKTCPA
jgi:para-nitrobenzyl esterase